METVERLPSRRGTVIASTAMVLAGLLHLAVAPAHWSHAPAHGLFFAGAGVVQLAWAIAFWRSGSRRLGSAGFVLAAVLVLLWMLTRVAPAPFGHGPEEIDAAGIATNICEAVCAAALLGLIVAGAPAQAGRRSWRRLASLAVVSLVLTGLTYGIARAAEPLLPGLKAPEAETHEHAPAELTPEPSETHDYTP